MVAGVIKFYLKREKIDEAIEYWNATLAIGRGIIRSFAKGSMVTFCSWTTRLDTDTVWNPDHVAHSKAFQQSHFYIQKTAELESFCTKPITREEFEIEGGNLDFSLLDKLAA